MASNRPTVDWQGYVNQLLYRANLRERLDDEVVEQIVEDLLQQRTFTSPVEIYYQAGIDALRSGQRLAFWPDEDEDATHDALTRILNRLDARRPWPIHPFYQQDTDEWPALATATATVIGRMPLSERQVQHKLNRVFRAVGPDPDGMRVLVLALRTGQLVALRTTGGFSAPGIDVLAHSDPASTLADLRELTGLDAEPT